MAVFENLLRDSFPFGLPVSAVSADWLGLAAILKEAGPHSPPDTQLLRQLAARFNMQCASHAPALNPVSPGQLITAGMIVELLRYVALIYCYQQKPGSLGKGLRRAGAQKGARWLAKP